MREESHLDEMRSALRGDFERLAQRRGAQELLRIEPAGEDDEPETASTDERDADTDGAHSDPASTEPVAPRSWIDRVLGR